MFMVDTKPKEKKNAKTNPLYSVPSLRSYVTICKITISMAHVKMVTTENKCVNDATGRLFHDIANQVICGCLKYQTARSELAMHDKSKVTLKKK